MFFRFSNNWENSLILRAPTCEYHTVTNTQIYNVTDNHFFNTSFVTTAPVLVHNLNPLRDAISQIGAPFFRAQSQQCLQVLRNWRSFTQPGTFRNILTYQSVQQLICYPFGETMELWDIPVLEVGCVQHTYIIAGLHPCILRARFYGKVLHSAATMTMRMLQKKISVQHTIPFIQFPLVWMISIVAKILWLFCGCRLLLFSSSVTHVERGFWNVVQINSKSRHSKGTPYLLGARSLWALR